MLNWQIFILFIFFNTLLQAQTLFRIDDTIEIEQAGKILNNGTGGGLNSTQYQQMDLNNDGIQDLVLYERSAKRLLTYIAQNNQFVYAPRYEQFFPDKVDHWLVLADYNCDGKNDLFTSSIFGMSLFENTSDNGSDPSWKLIYETIFTEGSSGQINLQVNAQDYPGIQDVDGDGDLDVLVYDFASGGGIEFHKNMSIEHGVCGLDLVRVSRRYGDFEECSCEEYVFGSEVCIEEGGRLQHSGGKSILSYDFTGSGLQDLVIGQEFCTNCGYLINVGSIDSAHYNAVSFDFPTSTAPLKLNFPATFVLDMNFDGANDIIASPNIFEPDGSIDFQATNWLYLADEGGYSLSSRNYLQQEMIDIGYRAVPSFGDVDQDGDYDLLLGSGANGTGAAIWFFENTGTPSQPRFKFISNDLLGLSLLEYNSISVQMVDLNSDGWVDIITNSEDGSSTQSIVYWHTQNVLAPYSTSNSSDLALPPRNSWDQAEFVDVNLDGQYELFIGKVEGSLSYYKNVGSLLSPTWELISDSFLGLDDNFQARNLHLAVGDLNGDKLIDMITYDDSKTLRLYLNFLNDPVIEEKIIIDSLTQQTYGASLGTLSYPTLAPIYGTKLPSIAIGLFSGGLNVLSNLALDDTPVNVPINLSVFPNPVNDGTSLSVLANQPVTASVFDAMGKELASNIAVPKGVTTQIYLGFLRAGIYILKTKNQAGEMSSKQVMVLH